MEGDRFYGPEQAAIHDRDFGDLAREAAAALLGLLGARNVTSGTVTDLGCGSGILARALCDAGFAVIGVDLSPAMIELARRTAPDATLRCASLLDAPIVPSVAVTATGEALNYATDPEAGLAAAERLARRTHAALAPGGVFLFDVATHGRNFGARVREKVHELVDGTLCMWAEESARCLDRRITIYTLEPDGRYRRTDEHHVLHLYDPEQLRSLLIEVGFTVEVRAAYRAGASASTPPSGWSVFVASKPAIG